jgi:hypothetical protein
MDETPTSVSWNSQLELILSQEGERALCYSWLHNNSQKRYTRMDTYITLPTILLSTLSGSASIGSASMFPGLTGTASLAIGFLSLSVGVLNTVSSYFGWGKRSESHKSAGMTYSKIHRFIMIELSLPRSERMAAKDMLKVIRDQLDRLMETSPQIPDPVIELFRQKFYSTTPNITKPEITNGLDPIHVYHEELSPRFHIKEVPIMVKTSTDDHTQDTSQTLSSAHLPTASASDSSHT